VSATDWFVQRQAAMPAAHVNQLARFVGHVEGVAIAIRSLAGQVLELRVGAKELAAPRAANKARKNGSKCQTERTCDDSQPLPIFEVNEDHRRENAYADAGHRDRLQDAIAAEKILAQGFHGARLYARRAATQGRTP
jgi:hypothetical protein